MADQARARKIADRIKQLVATTLDTKVKDPRLGFVTVTDCRVTSDLEHATVFYTVFGDDEARTGTAAALTSAKGIIRSEVGRGLGIRLTPSLEFVPDALPETAAVIDDALKVARERDAALRDLAAKATPAGDADPYKKPRVDPQGQE